MTEREVAQGMDEVLREIEQSIAKHFGYPRYVDDLENFPGATEASGYILAPDEDAGSLVAKLIKAHGDCIVRENFHREATKQLMDLIIDPLPIVEVGDVEARSS